MKPLCIPLHTAKGVEKRPVRNTKTRREWDKRSPRTPCFAASLCIIISIIFHLKWAVTQVQDTWLVCGIH